jgi:membrane protease YdiL (CAAX protease family)
MPELLESEAPAEAHVRPEAVAPWPHTLFILAVLALWAMYGARYSPVAMIAAMPRSVFYASEMVLEYLIVGSTIAGLYHRRQFIAGVLGNLRAHNVLGEIGKGFLVYLGGLAAILVVGLLLWPTHLLHKNAGISAIAPHSRVDVPVWILVSLTAGVCEEFIFRGYLLRQFRRWFGSAWIAIGLSALLFGCMHFYEGVAAAIQICGLGAFFGYIAVRRDNLRQVMIAHFFQDAITGLVLYLRH